MSTHEPPAAPLPLEPEDPGWEGVLRAALEAASAGPEDLPDLPDLPDEEALLEAVEALEDLRRAAEGPGGSASADAVWADAVLRGLVADVADALASTVEEPASTDPLNPHVRSAVLAAYGAVGLAPAPPAPVGTVAADGNGRPRLTPALASASGRGTPGRPQPGRAGSGRRRLATLVRVAAVLLVALGAALVLRPNEDATAGLWVRGMDRVSLSAGRPEGSSGRRLAVGCTVGAEAGELVAVRLPFASTVVLDGRSRAGIEVVAADPSDPAERDLEAVLRLVRGTALLQADAGDPLALRAGGQRMRLEQGEARVELPDRPSSSSAPVGVALRAGSVLRVRDASPGGARRPPETLRGPARFVVSASGNRRLSDAVPADLFEALASFGHELPPRLDGRRVAPRRWRIVSGPAKRHGSRVALLGRGPGDRTLLAWQPDDGVAEAAHLELEVPGLTPSVEVSIRAGDETLVTARPDAGRVRLALPPGWRETVGPGEIRLAFCWTDDDLGRPAPSGDASPSRPFFAGAAFLPPVASLPASSTVPAAAPGGLPGHDDR